MKIKDDFSEKDSALNIPPAWFNTLAKFYNYLTGEGCIVEKPANASENNPPVIRVTGSTGGAVVSDVVPVVDSGTGSAGTGADASRFDHAHPANVDNVDPANISAAAAAGTSGVYARRDHTHKGAPYIIEQPGTYVTSPGFWGEFSTASGGGSAPTTNAWVAEGYSGHDNKGIMKIEVQRVWIDNSVSTPNLCATQVNSMYSRDGRLLAVSDPFDYVISPTIPV